jgi:hypothetical protein
MLMTHGNNDDFIIALFVDHTVWKTVYQAAPGAL